MSKQRALELLCESAIKNARSSEFESAILYLVDSIRELAKDDTEHANLDDLLVELQRIQCSVESLREDLADRHAANQGR